MNPALENVAMSLGKPVGAFPGQDHLAHMQVLLDYAKDPMYGSNPVIAMTFMPAGLEHLKQHLTLWYLDQMDQQANAAMKGKHFNVLKEEPILREAQQLLAVASQHVFLDVQQQFAGVAPVMQHMIQTMQQLRGMQQPQDPSVQALVQTQMAETQRKSAYDQARAQLDAAKLKADSELKQMQIASAEQIKAAEITHDVNVLTIEKQYEQQQATQQAQAAMAQQQQAAAQQQSMEQQPQPVAAPQQGT